MASPAISRVGSGGWRMIHVDDPIEPGAKQILLARLPPFPWPHLVPPLEPRYDRESRIRFARKPHSNAQFPANSICKAGRFAIPNQALGRFFTDDEVQLH